MSETPTVAEQAAPPPPDGSPSDEGRPDRQPLAFMLTHQSGVVIVVALIIALAVGALLIRLQGVAPLFAYETLIKQALFVPDGLTRTLQKTAPLVLTGLAVVLPLRVGLFNIGGQGQLIFGAMFGAWVAYAAGGYGILGAVLGMVAGIVAGAFVGWIAGVLKATRGVHEVITTIMLNYIAAGVTWWLVTGPLQAESSKTSGIPQTELIPESAQVGAVAKIPIGFVIAVVLAVACWWMLSRSTLGFRFNTVGANKHAARYAGINISRIVTLSMVLGGGLAGLAGALEAEGTLYRFEPADRRHPGLRRHHHRAARPGQPAGDDPGGLPRRRAAHRGRRPAVRDRHRPRGGRRAARDDPAHGVDPGARQVDLPQPRRQGQRRVDELGELT